MMMDNVLLGGAVGAVGLLSLVAGGVWAALHEPSATTRSVVQHVAAGTVFAGITADVLARLLKEASSPWVITLGMLLGLGLMMTIRSYARRQGQRQGGGNVGLGFTIVADVLTDGLLMGLSIASGSPVAIVFVVALAPELALLGLTLSDELGGKDWSRAKRVVMPAVVGVGVVVGGVVGGLAASAPQALKTGIESFGAIALAYLVTEELLRKAHFREADPRIAATFFAAFGILFVAAAAVTGKS